MVTTGQITAVNSGSYTVFIPQYDIYVEADGEEDLPSTITTNSSAESTVRLATLPGITPLYCINDEVFVCIEDNVLDKIVIMGLANRPNKDTTPPLSNIDADVLKVVSEATLPKKTSIGEVSDENIATLKGMKVNILEKFTEVETTRDKLLNELSDVFAEYFN